MKEPISSEVSAMEQESMRMIEEITAVFFDKHWKEDVSGVRPGPWRINRWDVKLENNDKQGCYVFLNKVGEIIYVGVGAGQGSGIYKGHGLGARIYNNYYASRKIPMKLNPRWEDIDRIATICFEQGNEYLAYGLEAFLIGRLSVRIDTFRNVIGRRERGK